MMTIMAAKAPLLQCNVYVTTQTSKFRSGIRRGSNSTYPTVRMQTRIHRLIGDQGIVLMPGCYDALSAAIVQKTGFSAGYALSASLLGKPDFGLLTPPEMAATARTVCAAAPMIPIIADADTGGGNALNVQRAVKDLIAAGAAGCFLEDQAWPKKCGALGKNGKKLKAEKGRSTMSMEDSLLFKT